jgi:hypothetical protein
LHQPELLQIISSDSTNHSGKLSNKMFQK